MSARFWSAFMTIVALAAASAARKGLTTSWRAATGKNPPANPADPDVDIKEAVAWAAFSGTFVAIVRMLASRRAASYVARSTGKPFSQATGKGSPRAEP
ncbi:MAG: DUF4235 domain-containing protein [Nocardioides sp.]